MYIYGPVLSRRLGRSLEVSLVPSKTCTCSCVYCDQGATDRLQVIRESFYPRQDILDSVVERARDIKPDHITFTGHGEPTLSADLGWLIRQIKSKLSIDVAVMTNGSLLPDKDVRLDLNRADIINISLNAGNEKMYRSISRAHQSLDFSTILKGLIDFRRGYFGRLWIETMLIKDWNDSEEELWSIRHAIDEIEPDRVYVTIPTHPPAESWVRPPDPQTVILAQEIIGRAVPMLEVEKGEYDLRGFADARQAIIEIGSRHPLRLDQAERIEAAFVEHGTVSRLIKDDEMCEVRYDGRHYLIPKRFSNKNPNRY
nr:radical SAM protein [candidate division Zixibacteria bacterium]